MRYFKSNDIIEYAGDEYLVLMNHGDSGTVAAMNDGMQVVEGFRWKYDGEDCRFVRRAIGATRGLLPDGLWKYVRFADGSVDFCDVGDYHRSHSSLVAAKKDIPAVSAGKIKVREGRWVISEGGSVLANLKRRESDEKYIEKVIPLLRYDPDLSYEY